MKLVLSEHIAQLTDPANWRDNPFVAREARRDLKRGQPTRALAWMLGTLSVFGGLTIWVLLWLRGMGYGVPWFAGGAFGTTLCIVIGWIHAAFISHAARKDSTLMLAREMQRNTLPGLLTLPTPALQMLFQAGVYSWVAAMRLALAGLPFYLLCVAAGGLSWRDVLMLYVLFALTAVSFPAWSRPMLTADATAGVAVPTPAGAAATTGQSAAAANAATGAPQGFSVAPLLFVAFLFMMLPGLLVGGLGRAYASLHRYAPDSILQLLPSAFFSWPLLFARGLITPFDFFGLPLPPLPFILANFVATRYLALARSSEYLRVGAYRDLALLPTYLPRRELEARVRIGQIVVATGYLWKWAVADGGLSGVVSKSASGGAPGLAGFVYLLLFVTAFRTMGRVRAVSGWRRPKRYTDKDPVPLSIPHVERLAAWRYMAAPYGFAVSYYLACCVLSRTWPFPPAVCALAGKMVGIGLAGALMQYGLARLLGAQLGIVSLGLLVLVCFGPPEALPLAVFSPTLGLVREGSLSFLGLFRFLGAPPPPGLLALFQHPSPWWTWVLACGGAGGLLLLWTIPGELARQEALLVEADRSAPDVQPVVLDPTLVGREVFLDTPVARQKTATKTDTPLALKIVAFVQRIGDNPIATKEIRAGLRGRLDLQVVRTTAIVLVVLTASLLSIPAVSVGFGGVFAVVLFGPLSSPAAETAGSTLACLYCLSVIVAISIGMSILPRAFAPEREKSTLGFLLTTPMRPLSIVLGKAAGLLVASSPLLAALGAWTLALSVLLSPSLGLDAVAVWGRMILTLLALLGAGAGISLAIASLFPRAISQVGCGVLIYLVTYQAPVQLMIQLSRPARWGRARRGIPALPFDGQKAWLIFLGICLILTLISLPLAVWGVRRMRRGDILFEGSKQEN